MIDVEKHVDFIIAKFKQSGGYSEISEEQMRNSIRKYLSDEHDRDVHALSYRLKTEQANDLPIDGEFYKREVLEIKKRFVKKVTDVAYVGEDSTEPYRS